MNYRGRTILSIAGISLLLLFLAILRCTREPVFSGKPLSYWIAESEHTSSHRAAESKRVLDNNVPEAVRFLLDVARAESSMAHELRWRLWARLPLALREHLPRPHVKDDCLSKIYTALHRLGSAAKPELTKALEDPNADVRFVAGASFPYPQDDSDARVDWYRKLLRLADYDLRQAAAASLCLEGTNAYAAIPALLDTMQHDSIDYIRENVADSLARLAPGISSGFAPRLRASLKDPVPAVRIWSAIALWRVECDPEALSLLITEFNNGGGAEGATYPMLTVFGEAGRLAERAIPAIEEIINSPARFSENADFMANARETLLNIQSAF